jgi:hypothetical protein
MRAHQTVVFAVKGIGLAGAFATGVLALAACQNAFAPRDAPSFEFASYGLHYIDTGATAKLAYGRANSEMLGLMLECAKGSRQVEITDVAREARVLSLRADGKRSDFPATFEAAPGAPIVSARAPAAAPALKGFRQTGRLQVTNGSLVYDVVATPAEKPHVEQFFAACERTA